MDSFSLKKVNKFVLKKHHLTKVSKINDILQITKDLCGLHATGTLEPYIQLFIRTNEFKKEDLDRELYLNHSLGRIRGMRKTLFIQTREMIPIVYNVIRFLTDKRDKKYLEYRKISLEEYEKISKKLLDLLNENEMSTSEIKKRLNSKKDITAVISVMCDRMELIRGKPLKSWKDRRLLYAPFKKYFPNLNLEKYDENQAIESLIQQYIKTYGPVTEDDIVWWVGISKSKAKKAIENCSENLEKIEVKELTNEYYIYNKDIEKLKDSGLRNEININLLPLLDPYIMGYKKRERYIDFRYYENVFDKTGNATSTILLNGRVVGVWDLIEKPDQVFKIFFFEKINQEILSMIQKDAIKLGRFLIKKDVKIKVCEEMIPLTERSLGSFMSALKNCN
jgi:hypothetical protein